MLGAASLAALTVFALGCWPAPGAAGLRIPGWQSVANVYGRGLLIGFALGLVAPSLTWLARGWWIPVAWCAVSGLVAAWRTPPAGRIALRDVDLVGLAVAALLLVALLARVMAEPIAAWDARSVWYFHAKVLFYGDHSLDQALWTTPSIRWSNVDYPKLNAVWAALWMKGFAGWNEFLPKVSLFLLEVPVVLLCLGFSRATLTRGLLLAMLLFRMDQQLWNGYMDGVLAGYAGLGVLAGYAGLGVLYGIRYVRDGDRLDLTTVLVVSGLCLGLKNEGAPLAVCILAGTLAGRMMHQRRGLAALRDWRVIGTAACAGLGPAIWSTWAASAGIANEVATSSGNVTRFRIRLMSGDSVASIWKALAATDDLAMIVLCVVAAAGFWAVNRSQLAAYRAALLVGLAIPLAYLAILTLVYLGTPLDLPWHLMTDGRGRQPVAHQRRSRRRGGCNILRLRREARSAARLAGDPSP
jgi:hypothetical protein